MKIGIITSSVDGNRTGIGNYTYNLVKNLTKIDKENKYTLIHHRYSNNEIYNNNELIIPRLRIPLKETISNNIILSCVLRNHDFDIVHDPSQISPFLFKSQSKKVLTIHDLTPILFPRTFGYIHAFLQRYILPITLKNVDTIIAVSENTKQDIIKYLKFPEERIKVTYRGIGDGFTCIKNTDDVKEKYNIKNPFILFVGTLEPRKNILTLLKAFHKLKKNGIDHTLVFVGSEGWKYKSVYETIRKLNIPGSVMFLGYVPDKDLPKIYNAADLLVYPSFYEGFGLSPLEAMACGCPVITSNTSSLPEVVGDAGIMVDPYDVDDLANAMKSVLLDEILREKMTKKGLERAKRFNWEECAKRTLEIYREVGR